MISRSVSLSRQSSGSSGDSSNPHGSGSVQRWCWGPGGSKCGWRAVPATGSVGAGDSSDKAASVSTNAQFGTTMP